MLSKIPSNLPPHLSLKFLKIHINSGDLGRARQLFDKIPDPDLRSWTVLITAYTRHGFANEAVKLYTHLRDRSIQPDKLVSSGNLAATFARKILQKMLHVLFVIDHSELLGVVFAGLKCKAVNSAIDGWALATYRDHKGRSSKSKTGNLGNFHTLVGQVLEIRLQRASKPGSGGFHAKGLAYALRRPQLQGGAPALDTDPGGLHEGGRSL
ncbi:hypothetical protein RJ639_005636 [Escallonia herrerae]|uniref:Pentatricopeptide repeat-containing protein n=1 Tax=Escallonia herrerae TaxID=1293975 RepID=A0AA88VXB5_9ASTE|nr:hypothetical protein RJ639_005636 [Escallonia herrerae]